ncbi:MAG: cellulase family glycosylhydrolase [Spirochaetales bacterium]|nr:cellulase family glycosylhydrolase [Spirochaetales bacterium]
MKKKYMFLVVLLVLSIGVFSQIQGDDWLHTNGNQILDKDNNPVWLTGINWFGFNCTERVAHGLYANSLSDMLDICAYRGFNIIRLPFSTELLYEWMSGNPKMPQSVNYSVNPGLEGLNSLELFDVLVDEAKARGIKLLIDVHSAMADNSGHVYPLWYDGSFDTSIFMKTWEWFAQRYKNEDTIIAYDLENEPHGGEGNAAGYAKWDNSNDVNNWKKAAQDTALKILAINPNVLILVEGVEVYRDPTTPHIKQKIDPGYDPSTDYLTDIELHHGWWGGNLMGVKDYPINLGAHQDQLVYSPHDYGPSVYNQPWFEMGQGLSWNQMNVVWDHFWLFIHNQKTAPLLIGEWGGHMVEPNITWLKLLRRLLIEQKIHHTFWCLNPNSGDTGGILDYAFKGVDEVKYALLEEALWQDSQGRYIGLDHVVSLNALNTAEYSKRGTNVTLYYGGTIPTADPNQPTPAPANPKFELLYKCADNKDSVAQVKPHLQLKNTSSTPADLSDVTIRYFYTKEGDSTESAHIDYAALGSTVVKASMGSGYMEIGFSSGTLGGNANTGDIQSRFGKSDYSSYDQTNDFSFDPAHTSFSAYNKMAVYYKGELVYGSEPGGMETPTPIVTDVPPTPGPDFNCGDVNDDDTVNIVDSLLIAQLYVGLIQQDEVIIEAADVNKDGSVNIVDALLVAQSYVGIIELDCN